MSEMRPYKLLENGDYYDFSNIKKFDFKKLKDIASVYMSSLGAFGVGGLVYIITSNGEEFLFNYSSIGCKHNQKSPVLKILKKHLPVLNGELNDFKMVSGQVGWSFYVKNEYLEELYQKCEECYESNEMYSYMKDKNEALSSFVIPMEGPRLLYNLINENKENSKESIEL